MQNALEDAVRHVRRRGAPGVHLAVSVGDTRWQAYRGFMQTFGDNGVCQPRRLAPNAAHDLGSVTKVLGTTAMLMSLVAAERLDLQAQVRRFVPAYRHGTTLADLLRHRAGLWEWWPTYVTAHSAEEAIARVCTLPLRYQPGTARHYSDLGFMLLGAVVESVAGAPLPQAFVELVTSPLRLEDAGYGGPTGVHDAVPTSPGDRNEQHMLRTGRPYPVDASPSDFTRWRRHVLSGEVNDGNAFHAFGGAAGHAGLFATVEAVRAFGQAVLDSAAGDGPWPKEAVDRFWTEGPDSGQLLGFRRWAGTAGCCRASFIGHTGFPGAGLGVVPEHDAVVVLATNRLHVLGEPVPFMPMWNHVMHAVHTALHGTKGQR